MWAAKLKFFIKSDAISQLAQVSSLLQAYLKPLASTVGEQLSLKPYQKHFKVGLYIWQARLASCLLLL